jgi:hypothetical protein
MNQIKNILILLLLNCLTGISFAQTSFSVKTITDKQHPRILLLSGEERQIQQSIAGSPIWKKMHETILKECDNIILLPPIERIQIGRRLLDKSREAIRRIFYLSYAYRLTGQDKYFQRCEKEMLAIARFSDWNPSHFLDVAEMTMAVSIGYDWLYPKLSAESQKLIRDAIVYKGIYPSLDPKYNSWLKTDNNWNQVCNAGMTYGALAVAEEHPGLAQSIIERAIGSIPISMNVYKPEGAYPEGYGYWGYGTSFNVMFLSAVETAFNSDFGLNETPGFLQTAGFLQHMTGVTGPCFNWGDAGQGGGLNPAMFWLAQKNNDPSQLWVEKGYLQRDDFTHFIRDRLLPAIMIWGKDLPLEKVSEPKVKAWQGQGANPVAMMRTSWTDPNAIYVGFKAGSPSVNHGHMDVGSFIMEADGVRWASDFGMQDYESLESKGMNIFGRTQDAQRWTIFRLNNYSHSTLIVDNQLQQVKGYAKIDRFSDNPDFMYSISDISSVYENQLSSAKRGVAVVDQKYVVVCDELVGTDKPTTVRWNMLTSATPKLGKNGLTLTKDGKTLVLKVNTDAKIKMKTWPTAPTTTYDAPNPGTTLVGFECEIQANTKQSLEVILVPEKEIQNAKFVKKPLSKW